MKPVIIVSTFPNKTITKKVANQLIKKKLVACVNITKIDSIDAGLRVSGLGGIISLLRFPLEY